MAKRLQIFVSDASMEILIAATKKANEGFEIGTVTVGDVVDQAISQLDLDATELQAKKTDLKKALKVYLKEENLSADNLIQKLSALSIASRKNTKQRKVNSMNGAQDE